MWKNAIRRGKTTRCNMFSNMPSNISASRFEQPLDPCCKRKKKYHSVLLNKWVGSFTRWRVWNGITGVSSFTAEVELQNLYYNQIRNNIVQVHKDFHWKSPYLHGYQKIIENNKGGRKWLLITAHEKCKHTFSGK